MRPMVKYVDFVKDKKGVCPFCDPKDRIILERPHAFATYNIAPVHKHQIMVIPYRHIQTVRELTPEEWSDINELMTEGIALIHKLGYEFTALMMRDGKHPGKSMEHLHFHLIPNCDFRFEPDIERAKREDKRDVLTPEQIAETLRDYENAKKS